MEIRKRNEPLRPEGAPLPGETSGKERPSKAEKPQLPADPGKPKPLADLLKDVKNTLGEPLPDVLYQISQAILKEKHLYVSPSEGVENIDLATSALLGQNISQEFIDRAAKNASSKTRSNSLDSKQEERKRLQILERSEAIIQKIRSGKVLSQKKFSG